MVKPVAIILGVVAAIAGAFGAYYIYLTHRFPAVVTVPHVDVNRYIGLWYEIADIPSRFQSGLSNVQAEYGIRSDGLISVNNTGTKGLYGNVSGIAGYAWPTDDTNARLLVRFFWPFVGEYLVMELDDDYQWVVVGHTTREFLWILSRNKTMDEDLYVNLTARARKQHFDTNRLVKMVHKL